MCTVRHTFAALCLLVLTLSATAVGVRTFSQPITLAGKSCHVEGVVIDLRDPKTSLKVGLAWGHVGRTESLAGIAARYGAVAAINGSFFDAYTKDAIKNPDMSLISGGQLIFKSGLGSLLGFDADNTPHLGIVRHRLQGTYRSAYGTTQDWFAYWLNRKPTAATSITLFDRQWGDVVEPWGGTSVVVEQDTVTAVSRQTVSIPAQGYVLHFRGEAAQLAHFTVGRKLRWSPQRTVEGGDDAAWTRVQEAIGAGPRVLVHGTPVFNPLAEGFSDPKILQQSGMRSAAGYTADGKLYLITTCIARVSDLGRILKSFGCVEGINLDGGASSGLWYRGRYLTKPGRAISNALLVLEK
ncbi:MAG TPA: phosphodiester glycosidase family protein [Armatimonadota bacterium]|jgi:hypothetical protein